MSCAKTRCLITSVVLALAAAACGGDEPALPVADASITTAQAIEQPASEAYFQGAYAGWNDGGNHDDEYSTALPIGFSFTYYGATYTDFHATTNGLLCFGSGYSTFSNSTIPSAGGPNNCIYAFWDDLYIYGGQTPKQMILYKTIGPAGGRTLVLQWTNMGFFSSSLPMGTFAVILYEGSNVIKLQYRQLLSESRSLGASATIGIENASGSAGIQHSYNTNGVNDWQAITYTPAGGSYTENSDDIYEPVLLGGCDTAPPELAVLTSPDESAYVSTTPTFQWDTVANATSYRLVISLSSSLNNPELDMGGLTEPIHALSSPLEAETLYYWAIVSENECGATWSPARSFHTVSSQPPEADDQSLSVVADSDLTITLTGSDPSGRPLTARISSLPAHGALYQYDNGSRGAAVTAIGTVVSDGSWRVIYNSAGSGDGTEWGTFRFKVRNDVGIDSSEAVVTVGVESANLQPTGVALSNAVVIEHEPAGALVGALCATDPDPVDSHIFTVQTAGAPFAIANGDELRTTEVLDVATMAAYDVMVRATDGGGLYVEDTFHIIVLEALGAACDDRSECGSGFCVDGVCCNSACTGEGDCRACSVSAGAAVDGVCGPSTGTACDDGSVCTQLDTCQQGACVGASPIVCSALDQCHAAGACDSGTGQCSDPEVTDGTACNGDTGACVAGVCLAAAGQECADAGECASGQCVDDVCCASACNGQCEACDIVDHAGECLPVTGDPHGTRAPCAADGSACDGACDGAERTTCAYPGEDTACRAAGCEDGVAILSAQCDGSGACPDIQTQSCDAYACGAVACLGGCAKDGDCASRHWCSGGVCVPWLADGESCAGDNQCDSGSCTDGLCCDARCEGQCEACDTANHPGECLAVAGAPHGARPTCTADGSACDGICDGASRSACAYPGFETECRTAGCEDGVATLAAQCDGGGACPAVVVQSCGSYQCGTAACLGECQVDDECAGGFFCQAGICKDKREQGEVCTAAHQCLSGTCADGRCCDSACTGQCEACDVAGYEGACTPVRGAPHGARPACATDGSMCGGACDGIEHGACAYPGTELTCRVASCTESVATLAAGCDGAGRCPAKQQQPCGSYDCWSSACLGDCRRDSDCAAGHWCSAGVCLARQEDGEICSGASQCTSGHCVDGVCCDSACEGQCEACDAAGNVGQCVAFEGAPHGARPACATDGSMCGGACDGIEHGACAYPAGVCRLASCSAGVAIARASCDGAGACPEPVTTGCGAYACDGEACGVGCDDDTACGDGNVCFEASCMTHDDVAQVQDARLADYRVAGSGMSCAAGGTGGGASLLLGLFGLVALLRRRRRHAAVIVLALLTFTATDVGATAVSAAIMVQRFQPEAGLADLLVVQSARTPGHGRWGVSAWLNYAAEPLRLVSETQETRALVGNQLALDLGGTIGFLDRYELSLVVPVVLSQDTGGGGLDARFRSAQAHAGVADVRLIPKMRIAEVGAVRVAVAAPLGVALGDSDAYLGSGMMTLNPRLLAEWGTSLRVAANLGVALRSRRKLVDLEVGSAVTYALGVEVPVPGLGRQLTATACVDGEVGLAEPGWASSPAELLVGARWNGPAGLTASLGGGPGLTSGYGTPRFRLLASIGIVPPFEEQEQEQPHVSKSLARKAPAPTPEPEVEPAVAESQPPPPPVTEPEPPPEAEAMDSVTQPEVTGDRKVKVGSDRIEILEKIYFATGEETVLGRSIEVVRQVAAALAANPQIEHMRVEGHTDDRGDAIFNRELSQRRAESVVRLLIAQGIPAEKLDAAGVGADRPIDSNATARGRANNRRVELVVVR